MLSNTDITFAECLSIIIDKITEINPSCIYIAVGSAHENGQTDDKNQQYPAFIDNMRAGKEIISIQFDPRMETPMTMVGLFDKLGNPLTLIHQVTNNETPYFRIYKNTN
jgi:hypothetical protein